MLYRERISKDMETGIQKSLDTTKAAIFSLSVHYYIPVT